MVEQILRELETKGYSYSENLLTGVVLSEINQFFENERTNFEAAKVGASHEKQRVESIRGDYTFWIDPLNPPGPFKSLIQFLDELKEQVNASFYLGLKQYECHLAFYPPGTFYQKHLDRFATDSSRRLSFIFYLNQDWEKTNGGELIIYNKKGDVIETVWPMPGSFIAFLSDEFPHEVKSGNKERRSFTGWMHNKIIY
jgi:SM-20-related protein